MHVVSIMAHADDEMRCLGTLLKCRARGDRLHFVTLTDGSKGFVQNPSITREEAAAIREAELRSLAGAVEAEYINLREPMRRHFYTPIMQEKNMLGLALQVRTTSDPELIASAVRNQVRELDPHLPLYDIKTLAAEIDQSLVQERLVTWLTTSFGVLATLLVVIGLYGVLIFRWCAARARLESVWRWARNGVMSFSW